MLDVTNDIGSTLAKLYDLFFGPEIRLNLSYMLVFILIGFVIYLLKKAPNQSFFSWLFPGKIYTHSSHMMDIKLFILNRILSGTGLFSSIFITLAVMATLQSMLGQAFGTPEITAANTRQDLVVITLLITLTGDFSTYWVHRLSHSIEMLWPFHRVHHTAEVMTPVTTYRKHPIYDLLSNYSRAFLNGLTQGALLYFFFPEIGIVAIGTVNVIYYFFNILGSNFRHTHIALSYGFYLEHILISPSQHQVHHSLRVEHHNKNFGEIFALWDWAFGSLYISDPKETLEFGLADENGKLVPQIHTSLKKSLSEPFQSAFDIVAKNDPQEKIS